MGAFKESFSSQTNATGASRTLLLPRFREPTSNEVKTIFITSFHPLISRNILASPLLDILLGQSGVRVVILFPDGRIKRKFFNGEFSRPGVLLEGIPRGITRRDAFLKYLALAAINTRSLAIKRKTEMWGSGAWLTRVIANRRIIHRFIRRLDALITPGGNFKALCERYRPDIVFATDIQNEHDVRLLHEARRRGIATVGMVRSWDNLAAKGLIRCIPDVLAVSNKIIAEEARSLHGVPAERIVIVGVPHYDRYLQGPVRSREDFARHFGLDPAKRYVLYAPVGDRYLGENILDRDIIELLTAWLPKTHQLIVRLPFADNVSLETLPKLLNVVVMQPGGKYLADEDFFKNNELTREDDNWLRDMFCYSDIVVAGPSTMCVDGAFFGKPVVLVGFDGRRELPYHESVRRYYDYDHWKPVLAAQGVRLAKNMKEFTEDLDAYAKDPRQEEVGRERITREQCGGLDGRASERLAEVLRSTRGQVAKAN